MIEAGQLLNGRYKLLRPLGQGSQAFVWVAEHLALGSQVAVKLIDPELAKQEDARERFAREASAAAKLRSAHVVHILDHGIEGEQPFIIMELLDGEDLFDRLERRKRLTLAETSKVITQVARALMRAHAEGIIHRDLKPENVFLSRNEDDELAKVLDFGVAKITTPAKVAMVRTGVGTLIGTPHYMSPEQVKGLTEIDHRSDLWSLGVITYQCLTGQLPFDSEGVGDLLIKITMSQPPVPSTLNRELPPAFDEWFKKASAKDPDDRFETAREMADALARVVGAPMHPVSQPGRVLVNLADSVDLDWGSLAGVRIPIPPRKSAPPANPLIIDAKADRPNSRLPTLDADDAMVEVVHAGKPSVPPAPLSSPPAEEMLAPEPDEEPASAPPPSSRRLAPPAPPPPVPPPPGPPPAPPKRQIAETVPEGFDASPISQQAPLSRPSRPGPQSGRNLQTTVTGLSSPSNAMQAETAPEIEDNSRKRRATWMVAIGVVVVAGVVTVGVIRSRGGFNDTKNAAPQTGTATAQETAKGLAIPPPLLSSSASASSSSSADVYDPTVTKKPTAKPSTTQPTPPPGGFRPRPTSDGDEIELPTPPP